MNKHIFPLLALLLLCTASSRAQVHENSITVSPVHLVMPVFEVTAEHRFAPSVGVAGILGIGSYKQFSIFEIGASYRYYLIGDFDHGMQVGGELLYAHVSGDSPDKSVTGVGRGLGISPFLGYKYAADFGLTVELQGGISFIIATGTGTDNTTGKVDSRSDNEIGPLVNINFGWSF